MKKTIVYSSDNVYKVICKQTSKEKIIRAKNEKIAREIAEDYFNSFELIKL